MEEILGCGEDLRGRTGHPYIGRTNVAGEDVRRAAIADLNKGRGGRRGEAVDVTYYFEVALEEFPGAERPLGGIIHAARMVLEHGTLKPWTKEGDPTTTKPTGYDDFMSWATDIALLGRNGCSGLESGLVTIAYPLRFFDNREDGRPPLSGLFMAMASEPFSAFSFYRGARIVDLRIPPGLEARFPRRRWGHRRVREYLRLRDEEPIIGTIVKPKTGLTPELFSRCVLEAALAGASFTKADENLHLALRDIPRWVGRVVRDLEAAGFDLGRDGTPKGLRFLFAPHITTDPDRILDAARAAVEAGANALMFSPYHAGGFLKLQDVVEALDVPIYAHTAGMNISSGSPTWGIDPRVQYYLSALSGAAFMQITTVGGYLKPDDAEKPAILDRLRTAGLEGDDGMTLAIAGGMGPKVLGKNLLALGDRGKMLLAGTSVYAHPLGAAAGVKAMILAYRAWKERGIADEEGLREFARSLGEEGRPLAAAL
jgi:ribulose 1,5-bisphosphate carboxylase large subunit-like protein